LKDDIFLLLIGFSLNDQVLVLPDAVCKNSLMITSLVDLPIKNNKKKYLPNIWGTRIYADIF